MKKLFFALAFVAGLTSVASAQTSKTTVAKSPSSAKVAPVEKTTAASAVIAPGTTKATPAKTAAASKMKADGTPDMRYKANKTAAKPVVAGPLKKDGTADMRYKANQPAATKKP